MLVLKRLNEKDADKEYEAIIKIPKIENGFENKYHDVIKEEFINRVIPNRIEISNEINVPENRVPDTYFFLWNDDEIVGLFKIRHYLNDSLRNGAGHVGFCTLLEHRRKGYAKEGLKLAIEECKKLIREDEIYMSTYKYNVGSLKAQLANGAYIVSETDDKYLTRIKLNKEKR